MKTKVRRSATWALVLLVAELLGEIVEPLMDILLR